MWSFISRATLRALARVAVLLLVCGLLIHAQQAEPPELAQARQYFEALDYEQAMPLLDRGIAALEPLATRDPVSAATLVAAYELRARARFGTGNRDGAMTDFKAALAIDPGFVLGEGVSPRIVALLDEVKASTLGAVELTVDPPTAEVTVDNVRRKLVGTRLPLTGGSHTIQASRPGYKAVEQSVLVNVGETVLLTIALERVSSVVSIITSPPGTEIVIDATPRGKTLSGPLPAGLEEVPQRLGVPPNQVSQPLVLSDLTTGTFDVEFRRDCFVPQHRTLEIDAMRDVAVEPVKLEPAIGTLVAESEPAGVTVSLDSEARGTSPLTLEGVCAGPHVVEFKGPSGRAVQRVTIATGQKAEVHGRVRPGFALIAGPSATAKPADPRLAVERALADAEQLLLYAPPSDVVEDVLAREPVSDEWFGLTDTAASATPANRRERLVRLAEAFDAQGVAWVRPAAAPNEMQIALAAPGGADPDILTIQLDQPDSVKQALERLNAPLVLFRGSMGMLPVDVLDLKGVVVGDVEADGPAAVAAIKPGDIIDGIDGHAIESVRDLEAQLAGRAAGHVTLSVKSGTAAAREVPVTIRRVPVLQTGSDKFLPANAVVAVLRSRLAASTDVAEQAVLRLNLAAALLQAGAPADARTLLEQVNLPAGPGVSKGTVQYLIGEAALTLGDKAAAAQAFESARQAGGRLADDGPAVEALAGRALDRLK